MELPRHVAFVRAVMIGREGLHRDVLTAMFEQAGAVEVASHLSTGNVSFRCAASSVDRVADQVELDLELLLDRPAPLFIRSLESLVAMLASDPYSSPPIADVRDRLITFCPPGAERELDPPLAAPNGDWIAFATMPGAVFSVTRAWPDRQPQAPGGVIERTVQDPVTTRSVGTIERIVSKLTGVA